MNQLTFNFKVPVAWDDGHIHRGFESMAYKPRGFFCTKCKTLIWQCWFGWGEYRKGPGAAMEWWERTEKANWDYEKM